MRDLDQFGQANLRYEGLGEIEMSVVGLGIRSVPVYFELRQTFEGNIVLGCLSDDFILSAGFGNACTFSGRTTDGQIITISNTDGFMVLATRSSSNAPSQLHAVCSSARLVNSSHEDEDVHSMQFDMLNFSFSQNTADGAPFSTQVGEYQLTFTPVPEYTERIKLLRSSGGIIQTAFCTVEDVNAEPIDAAQVEAVLSDLLLPLSLASSTTVSWTKQTAFSQQGNLIQIDLSDSITKTFSNTAKSLRYGRSLPNVISGWTANEQTRQMRFARTRAYIRQYLEACARGPLLEARGLSAAILLDVMTNDFARTSRTADVVDEEVWLEHVYPNLTSALDSALQSLPDGLTVEQSDQSSRRSYLKYGYRRSFKQKLRRLLNELDITLSGSELQDLVDYRDSLVHNGVFKSEIGTGRLSEYSFLLWMGYVILLRMAGFDGNLPTRFVAGEEPQFADDDE